MYEAQSLAHTKWLCKYHIVFTPKYRRKIIYNQLRTDIRNIIKDLCKWKGVEILEGHREYPTIYVNARLAQHNKKYYKVIGSSSSLQNTLVYTKCSFFRKNIYEIFQLKSNLLGRFQDRR